MCTTKLSPTPVTGSPVAAMSIPELSMVTWPLGSHRSRKIVAGSAPTVRWTSNRSVVMAASCHGPGPLWDELLHHGEVHEFGGAVEDRHHRGPGVGQPLLAAGIVLPGAGVLF